MTSVALVGLAIAQDTFIFRFQPKVGEKYRYKLSMEDDQGHSTFPEGAKAFKVFKIAGVKDGLYTVHETLEKEDPTGATESKLTATYRIDSLLNSELMYSTRTNEQEGAGAAMAAVVNGCFGLVFPSTPMKLNEETKVPFDAVAMSKKFLPSVPPELTQPSIDGKGERTLVMERVDDKVGYLRVAISFSLNIALVESGTSHHMSMNQSNDQTVSIERSSGMPIKLDRKLNWGMKMGAEGKSITGTLHLERVN